MADDYRPRHIDTLLDDWMAASTAIEIHGARAVGKTETARRRARTVVELDRDEVRIIAQADPARAIGGEPPVLVDEWQRVPSVWDAVRRAVDADRSPGRFLLTGSGAPANPPTHSGAGRILGLLMRPMTLGERGVEQASVSMRTLLSGTRPALDGETAVDLARYATEIVASGFPGLLGRPERNVRAELDGYLTRITDRDVAHDGATIRDRAALMRWLRAYAAAASTTTSLERIRDAAVGGLGEVPAKTTVLRYLRILEQAWLIEPVPAWTPSRNLLRRLTLAPKHQLVDPALTARLLRVTPAALLDGASSRPDRGPLLGTLFESLVTLGVRVAAQASEATVSHLRDQGGAHEVDLVVEGVDGRVLAIEVKLGGVVDDRDVRHLRWLQSQIGPELADAIVVTTGRYAYRRPDGIGVVPAALLGP